MDWQLLIILAIIFFFLIFIFLRSEKRAKKIIALFITVPVLVLIVRWANFRQAWIEVLSALALAMLGILFWWFLVGRKLPPAEPEIRVWEKDKPFE